ncbi:multiheme c-type cytochrome [Persephonella sp.]|uniref:multiheme c-type cytochrome n=1 Tax=Persephonella sp. TaxID=2060922 RepID=UPI002629F5D4|nr:multiheme c-type cytochrome [Persephonella sp.]
MPLLLLLLAAFIAGCDKVEKLFLEEDLLQRPPAKRCSECHQNIYNQWLDSRHAKAWTSPHYIEASNNHTKTKCLSCHAPLEIHPEEKPQLRNKLRKEGVNCFSCHYKEETNSMHGPYDVFSPPHYSTYDPVYITSKVCSSCHQKTYQQWQQTASKRNCQECHMPAKKGRLIQKFPFTYLHSKKDIHSHKFPASIASEKDFQVKVSIDDDILTLSIKNTGIPHSVPTADNGKPKLYIYLTGFKNGDEIFNQMQIINSKDPLKFGKWKEMDFFIDSKPDKVVITILRKLSWKDKKEKVLQKEFQF